jgi:stalled ribosome rescue protein Dom34
MICTAVWVTSDEAKIFRFTPDRPDVVRMQKHGPQHHAETQGKNHSKAEGDSEHFLTEVARALLINPDRLLLCGPGLAKTHLKTIIEKLDTAKKHKNLATEALDKSTDPEIIAFAHAHFKKADAFESMN